MGCIKGLLIYFTIFLSNPSFGLDLSDYRQNTYGPPTHYCNPTRPLNSNGAGTVADPWNMSQCATQPVAGNIVGIMPGISVRLPATGGRIPAFNPRNSGTSSNRIVYVTRYPAVALQNVETNPNRTEFRHDGVAPSIVNGVGAGNGCAMIGSYGANYITFDGFYIDMAQAYLAEDSGVIRAENSIGIHFRNFVIKGATVTVASNPIIYRPQNARDTVLSNFRAYDFINIPTGSNTPQQALFSDQYGDQNVLIENFEIRNTQRGIFFKGTAGSASGTPVFNYGAIRYGIVSQVSSCVQINDNDPTNLTTVEYILCHDLTYGTGLYLSSETSPARNILMHHNTVARVDSSNGNTVGGISSRSRGIASNVTIRDNIIDIDSGRYGHGVDFSEIATLPTSLDFNAYYKNGTALSWAYNGTQHNSIAAWRAATSLEANSLVLTSSPFIDRAAGNFRVRADHPVKTGSSTGGEMGAFAGTRPPGVDTSGALPGPTVPTAPRNLRIQ